MAVQYWYKCARLYLYKILLIFTVWSPSGVYFLSFGMDTNLLLTEREGRTGEYWLEVVAVRTSLRSVRTKTTEGQYSPVRLEQARLVSSFIMASFSWAKRHFRQFHSNQLPA